MKMKWKMLFFVGAIAALLPGLAHSEDDLFRLTRRGVSRAAYLIREKLLTL